MFYLILEWIVFIRKDGFMNDKIVDYEIELVVNQKLYDSNQITRDLFQPQTVSG